ncbi:DUF6150 family protein [Hymenobacter sp. BT175]|uniref:DUF6150 family protein n=1 Tax=Hymenobacter translucens TaxID=2886507 RepID=UPI001D0E9458|nr:DUF6150 family protein [Hymenobacter translucens]MCC2546175.1 DUF6150 family protein [Hymenobacter translucens]
MFYSLILAGLLGWLPAAPVANPFAAAPLVRLVGSVEPCRIYGSVYLETDPRRRGLCFATVYVEKEEAFADVVVFREDNKLFADKAGLWYLTPTRDFADYTLFVTTNRALADFAITYSDIRSFAGCRQQ